MSVRTFSLVVLISVVWGVRSTTLPSLFVDGAPLIDPPKGQLLVDNVPIVDKTPPEGPSPPAEGGTPPDMPLKEWSLEEWSAENWSVEQSPVTNHAGIISNHHACNFVLETESSCYDWSGKGYIKIKLENCEPRAKDWIALYKASSNEVGKDKGFGYWGWSYDWQFTCGSRSCNYAVKYNYNYFTNWWQYVGNGNYKLDDGEYMIFLFSNDGYLVKAASEPFTVRNKYGYCDATQAPVEPPKCKDKRGSFKVKKGYRLRCRDVRGKRNRRKCKWKLRSGKRVKNVCPKACKNCPKQPTQTPTEKPVANPPPATANPTANPTFAPTRNPTASPIVVPTFEPTRNPTALPTSNPTASPTRNPTANPTSNPTVSPTRNPTANPTRNPTANPTRNPTSNPTGNPTRVPTRNPTANPTRNPTTAPGNSPAPTVTFSPTTTFDPTTFFPTRTFEPTAP